MKYTPPTQGIIVADEGEHVVLTGPIKGSVTLADGTTVDVGDPHVVMSSPEQAAEVAHLVALRYVAEGHPHDVETDPETGELVQRPFDYQPPSEFADTETKG